MPTLTADDWVRRINKVATKWIDSLTAEVPTPGPRDMRSMQEWRAAIARVVYLAMDDEINGERDFQRFTRRMEEYRTTLHEEACWPTKGSVCFACGMRNPE